MKLKSYSATHIGSRETNQDSYLVDETNLLFAVADGVGGGVKGDVASRMAVEKLRQYLPSNSNKLADIYKKIQADICKEAMETVGDLLMGTTLTSLLFRDSIAYLTHMGDSRCYWFENDVLKQMTEDHESYNDAMGGPVLCSYLGMPTDVYPLKILEESWIAKPGDSFLLCTDGLYKQISELELAQGLRNKEKPRAELLQEFCEMASKREFSDNITIVLIDVCEG